MKLKQIFAALILASAAAISVFAIGGNAEGDASGEEISIPADTPVTYGYLENFKQQLRDEIIAELTKSGTFDSAGNYEDITVSGGKMIILPAGSELIFRGGSAAVITSSHIEGDGITDISTGKELFSGEGLEFGHIYYPSSSAAQKAIIITGESACFTLRGKYEIR